MSTFSLTSRNIADIETLPPPELAATPLGGPTGVHCTPARTTRQIEMAKNFLKTPLSVFHSPRLKRETISTTQLEHPYFTPLPP